MKTIYEKHVIKEGSREHVLWWDSYGCHCSEKDCEVNSPRQIEEVDDE